MQPTLAVSTSSCPSSTRHGTSTSVSALGRYLHEAAGFPTKHTWLNAIKSGNFDTWPGLTYSNASKYFPRATETIKGHTTQTKQGKKPTKEKPTMVEACAHSPQQTSATTNAVHIYETTISKLYTDDCGRFPIKSRSGKQYIMIVYHCD